MRLRLLSFALALSTSCAGAASITVSTLADTVAADGACSLREALLNAASNTAGHPDCAAGDVFATDTIGFATALFPVGAGLIGEFQLDAALGPLIAAGGSVVVQPPNGRRLHLIGNGDSRLLRIDLPANRSFSMFRTHLIGGHAAGDGGAILVRSGSIVHLEDCDFIDNHADGSGGALGFDLSTNVTIQSYATRFVGNTAGVDGGAIGGVMATRINLDIAGSRFSGNAAGGSGGAIFLAMVPLPLSLQANYAIADSIFEDNSALSGGAIHVHSGSNTGNRYDLLIEDSRFSANQSLAPNVAGRGGALNIRGFEGFHTASVTILRSSFHDNVDHGAVTGAKAGAVFVDHADAVIENSLFAGNQSGHGGGGVAFIATNDFPGEPEQPRLLSLRFNSFHENRLGPGGGIARGWDLLIRAANGTLLNAAVYGNLFKAHPWVGSQLGCVIESASGDPFALPFAGHNLADRAECALGSGSVLADPMVVYAEESNASHLRTLHLAPDSPGRDLVPEVACQDSTGAVLAEDLLRALRPRDGNGDGIALCDAGAFEADALKDDTIFAHGFE